MNDKDHFLLFAVAKATHKSHQTEKHFSSSSLPLFILASYTAVGTVLFMMWNDFLYRE
ncbi:hypothetical protein [Enterococcus hirae]|nr:hypothetical protein [Enterococcus hirae]